MGRVGGGELYVILLALFLVFGPSRIGEIGMSFESFVRKLRSASGSRGIER